MTASTLTAAAAVCLVLLGIYWIACLMRHKPTIHVTAATYMAVHVMVGGWGMTGWFQPVMPATEERSILSY